MPTDRNENASEREGIPERTACVVAPLCRGVPGLSLLLLGREVDELDERPADVYGNVAHKVRLLVRQHYAWSVPPLLVCCSATENNSGTNAWFVYWHRRPEADVYGYVAHKVRLLVRQHYARGVPPLLVCCGANGNKSGHSAWCMSWHNKHELMSTAMWCMESACWCGSTMLRASRLFWSAAVPQKALQATRHAPPLP